MATQYHIEPTSSVTFYRLYEPHIGTLAGIPCAILAWQDEIIAIRHTHVFLYARSDVTSACSRLAFA